MKIGEEVITTSTTFIAKDMESAIDYLHKQIELANQMNKIIDFFSIRRIDYDDPNYFVVDIHSQEHHEPEATAV